MTKLKKPYLLLIPAALVITSGFLYRQNAVDAQKQVSAILAADRAGKPVTEQINELERYTKTHMNASVEFALQGSYSRAVVAAQAAALQSTQAGAQVYADAQASCSSRANSIVLSNCVTAYIAAHSTAGANALPAVKVDKSKYVFKFTSPAWSWDLTTIILLLSLSVTVIYLPIFVL